MITLREHIELTKFIKGGHSLDTYLNTLGAVEAITLKRKMQEVYPIKKIEVDYQQVDFNAHRRVFDLVLGQFIMVEQIFTGKDEVPKHLFDFSVLRIILRPTEDKEFDNTNIIKERENDNKILDLDVVIATSILSDFIEDRNKVLFSDFAGVFYDLEQEKEEGEEEPAGEETFEYKFREQWYWYNIVRRLGGENILNYDKVYMLKMESVLPELSFLIQKAKLDKAQEFRNRVTRGL
jgi:hypothetical protein